MKRIVLIIAITLHALGMFAAPAGWQVNPADYEFSFTITGIATINGLDSITENDLIGAFVDDVCRGVVNASYQESHGAYFFFLTVFSNTYQGEEVKFKYYSADQDSIFTHFQPIEFVDGSNYGSSSDPYIFINNYVDFSVAISCDSIPENEPDSTFVGLLTARIDDEPVDYNFALESGSDQFYIWNDSLFTRTTFNYELINEFILHVLGFNADSSSSYSDSLLIKITNVIEPVELFISNHEIEEQNASDIYVAYCTLSNEVDSLNYSISLPDSLLDNANFYLQNDSLFMVDPVNYESQHQFNIRFVMISQVDTIYQEEQIIILDVNEAPTDILLSNTLLAENEPENSFIGLLSAVDEDTEDDLLIELTDTLDFAKFQLVNDSLYAAQSFDYETDSLFHLNFKVIDAEGLSFSKLFEIKITDVVESSIHTVEKNITMTIFPNPAVDYVEIELKNKQATRLEVYAMTGKLMYTDDHCYTNYTLNVNQLDAGIYTIVVYAENKKQVQKLMVK